MSERFASCPKCNASWKDLSDFLEDAELKPIGYQVHFEALEEGLFFFNHVCGTTLTLPVRAFRSLKSGPIFQGSARGQPDCAGHCLRQNDLDGCPAECECAYVREILTRIRTWPKRGLAAGP